MKLILDWDEDTTDLVRIAIASLMLNLEDWTSAPVQEEVSILAKALGDLCSEDENEGIYPVKELLGSHEVRLLKEDT